VFEAIATLSPPLRVTLVLATVEDLPHKQIAEILEIPKEPWPGASTKRAGFSSSSSQRQNPRRLPSEIYLCLTIWTTSCAAR